MGVTSTRIAISVSDIRVSAREVAPGSGTNDVLDQMLDEVDERLDHMLGIF